MAKGTPIPPSLFHTVAMIELMRQTEENGKTAKLKTDAKHACLEATGTLMMIFKDRGVLSYDGFMTDIGCELDEFRKAAHHLILAVNKVGCLIEPADVPRPWTNPSMDAD